MIIGYTPEMGQPKPVNCHGELGIAHGGGWYVKTAQTLSGRGVKLSYTVNGKNVYKLTRKALEKVKQTMTLSYEMLLD